MNPLNKTISAFLAILFIISGVSALLLFNFDRNAFAAETYQQAFEREDFYNKIPSLLAQSITDSTEPTQQPLGMQGMSTETWESFMRTLLPPNVLKPIGDDVLISSFAYLNMESDTIQIDLALLKASMVSETGTQAALSLLNTLPPCTLEQSAMIMFGMFTGDQIQLCNPPENVLPMLTPLIQGQMKAAAAIIPDQLTLTTAPSEGDPREQLQTTRFFMRLSLIPPLLLLLTLTVFAVRSLKDWLTWWGIPFFVTGASAYLTGLLGAPVFGNMLQRVLINRMPDYLPLFLLDFASDLAAAMVRALLNPVMLQGLALAIVGLGMAAAGFFIKPKSAA
jgi:hypothetical protein